MSTHTTVRKVIAAAAISTAIGLTSLAGGGASADGPAKPPRYSTPLLNAVIVDNESYAVPLTFQAGRSASVDGTIPTETLSLNFDRGSSNK